MRKRDDAWIQTFTGRRFWPLDPRPDEVAIEDIAHALSMLCRYNGHCRRFYSVGEHSLLLCEALARLEPHNRQHQLQALLHDAAEAYLSDVPRPVKPWLQSYRLVEWRIERAITARFGLPAVGKTPLIAELDTRILVDEAEALMPVAAMPWHKRLGPPLGVEIRGLAPAEAEIAFLETFHRLWRAA